MSQSVKPKRSSPQVPSPQSLPCFPPSFSFTPRSKSATGGLSPGGGSRAIVGQVLPASPDATVIDVGCGTGANLASLAAEYRCVGIDTSADAIRLAKERFPQTQFIQGYAPDDLGKIVDEARLVLMMDVLEHVPDDFSLFSAVAAAMQPGTFLLVTVPADLRLWSGHDESFGHYRRYDVRRLAKIWQGLPIEPLMVSHFNRRLYPLIKGVRAINRWRGPDRVAGRSGTDFSIPAARSNTQPNQLCRQAL